MQHLTLFLAIPVPQLRTWLLASKTMYANRALLLLHPRNMNFIGCFQIRMTMLERQNDSRNVPCTGLLWMKDYILRMTCYVTRPFQLRVPLLHRDDSAN